MTRLACSTSVTPGSWRDDRLRHSELVHPALQGADGLLNRALLDPPLLKVGHLDDEGAVGRLPDLPFGAEEVLEDVANVLDARRFHSVHREGRGVHPFRPGEDDPLAGGLVAGGLHGIVDGGVQGVVHHYLEHEVDAALQVEAQLDLPGYAVPLVRGPDHDQAGDQESAVEHRPDEEFLADEHVGKPGQGGGEHQPERVGVRVVEEGRHLLLRFRGFGSLEAGHGALQDLDPGLLVDANLEGVVVDAHDGAEDAGRDDHLVSGFQCLDQALSTK